MIQKYHVDVSLSLRTVWSHCKQIGFTLVNNISGSIRLLRANCIRTDNVVIPARNMCSMWINSEYSKTAQHNVIYRQHSNEHSADGGGPCPVRSHVQEVDPCAVKSHVQRGGVLGGCIVRSNVSWVMVTWESYPMDRQTWRKTLPSRNFVGG